MDIPSAHFGQRQSDMEFLKNPVIPDDSEMTGFWIEMNFPV
jgi:hypothetical protein